MGVYADSSFIVSCDVVDANTPQARAYLSQNDLPLAFTALHDLEFVMHFALVFFVKFSRPSRRLRQQRTLMPTCVPAGSCGRS